MRRILRRRGRADKALPGLVFTLTIALRRGAYFRGLLDRGRMKVLLATHTFIWWDSDPLRLTPKTLAICQDAGNTLLLSVASVWEMQIKRHSHFRRKNWPLRETLCASGKTPRGQVIVFLV
jgi:hypothetical protein